MPHTHGLRPSEPSASVQLTSQPTNSSATFRRLVTVNQELAQHNAKVRLSLLFVQTHSSISMNLVSDRTASLQPSQLRHDLSEARRRAAVAANAETQAGIAVALHREKHAEAARLRCELLVRQRDPFSFFRKPISFVRFNTKPDLTLLSRSDTNRIASRTRATRSVSSRSRSTRRPVF